MQPLPNTQQREHRVVSGREMSPQIDQAVFSGAISFRTSWLLRPENILPALSIFPFHPFSATSKFNSSFVMRHSFVFLLQRPESFDFTAFVSALLPRLLLDRAERRIATCVPPATKSAEGAHRSASRIRSGALHIISRKKKLTIRAQNVGQWNCSGFVGPFRKVASPHKRGNFTLQLLEAHLRLRKLHQCILNVFGGSQGCLPIPGESFGICAVRQRDFGFDLAKIEQAPSQPSRPDGLERLPIKKTAPADAVETERAGKRNFRVVIRDRNADSLV